MLIDLRTYVCHAGKLNAHLALYEKMGKAPQVKCLGLPIAYMKTETGDNNTYIHIWMYENAADREARRARMWADAEWLAYVKASAELGGLASQTNSLMTAVDFFNQPKRVDA